MATRGSGQGGESGGGPRWEEDDQPPPGGRGGPQGREGWAALQAGEPDVPPWEALRLSLPGHAGASSRDGGGGAVEAVDYRVLVEQVPAVVYVSSPGGAGLLYIGPQVEGMLGYPRERWYSEPDLWMRCVHPDDLGRVVAEGMRAHEAGGPFRTEYRMVAKDGREVWVRDDAAPVPDDGRGGLWRGVMVDVTEAKEAESSLRRSEERFRLVAGVTGEAIWDNNLLTGVQEWDGATEALFGYPPHRAKSGAWWEERIHPDDKERVLSGLAVVLDGGGGSWEEAYRFRKADGRYAHVVDRARVVRDGAGRPVRMVGSMRDVTERREHEEALEASEELFRTTFEAAPVGMAHVAPDGRWLRINDKLCEISGYAREELLGTTYLDLTPPEDLAAGRERVRRLLAGEADSYAVERRYVRKDGTRVWASLSVSLVRGPPEEPVHFICAVEDVTARKLRELVPDPLTPLEADVLRLIVAGRKNREIAEALRYSMGTVKRCVQSIISKLGVSDRRRAAARAVDIGLVPPPATTRRAPAK